MELLKVHFAQEALLCHANATLTPRARLRVAQLVVDQGAPIAEVAARFQWSWPTVKRWAARYAAGEPMSDRSSRPHTMPAKTCPATTKRIVSLRLRKRPVRSSAPRTSGSHPAHGAPGPAVPAQPVGPCGPGHR